MAKGSRSFRWIRAFETVEDYASGLRGGLGGEAVFTRPATALDWLHWKPNLLYIDPPGLRSEKHPDYPTLQSLLFCAKNVRNVLLWLPMIGDLGRSGAVRPLHATTVDTRGEWAWRGFQVLAVCCEDGGQLSGCLIAHRLDSARVAERIGTAVRDVVKTMGEHWRLV